MNTFLRIDINVVATLFLGIVFSLAYRRLDHEDAFNKLYFRACIIIMVLTAGEALTCVINARPTPALVVVSNVIHMALFILPPVVTYYWYLLTNTLTLYGDARDMRMKMPYLIPVLLEAILTLLSPWLHLVFYFDAAGVYHRGPLFIVVTIISYSYLLLGFFTILRRRRRMLAMDYRFLTIFCLVPMIGSLVQAMFYGVLLLWSSSALALTILYLYLQERMVQTDYLTGAWTRSSFEMYVDQRIREPVPQPFGLIYLDVDKLKRINDTLGHAEGDVALRNAVLLVRGTLRKGDILARLGGDEFVLLLQVDTQEALNNIEQRIEQALERYNDGSGKTYRLTISLGAELFTDFQGQTVRSIVDRVDGLMYCQKMLKQQGDECCRPNRRGKPAGDVPTAREEPSEPDIPPARGKSAARKGPGGPADAPARKEPSADR